MLFFLGLALWLPRMSLACAAFLAYLAGRSAGRSGPCGMVLRASAAALRCAPSPEGPLGRPLCSEQGQKPLHAMATWAPWMQLWKWRRQVEEYVRLSEPHRN